MKRSSPALRRLFTVLATATIGVLAALAFANPSQAGGSGGGGSTPTCRPTYTHASHQPSHAPSSQSVSHSPSQGVSVSPSSPVAVSAPVSVGASASASTGVGASAGVSSTPVGGTGGGSGLPVTGVSGIAFAGVALALIGGGTALVLLGRRRRSTP